MRSPTDAKGATLRCWRCLICLRWLFVVGVNEIVCDSLRGIHLEGYLACEVTAVSPVVLLCTSGITRRSRSVRCSLRWCCASVFRSKARLRCVSTRHRPGFRAPRETPMFAADFPALRQATLLPAFSVAPLLLPICLRAVLGLVVKIATLMNKHTRRLCLA